MFRSDHQRTHDIPLRRLPSTQSDVTVIFLEDFYSLFKDYDQLITQMSHLDCCLLLRYTKMSRCIKYLKQARVHERIILVLDINTNHEQLSISTRELSQFNQYDRIQSIFIVIPDHKKINRNDCLKSIYVFHDYQLMFSRLHDFIKEVQENDDTIFTTSNLREKALRDVRHDLGPFVWSHSYRVILQAMPYKSSEAKQQMLTECRACCRNKHHDLAMITEFGHTYRSTNAIYWYTRPCFLYRIINRALRTENNLAYYTFRYFIIDMCACLEELARLTRTLKIESFRVYRGAKISRDEVEKLRVDMLVAPNGFFSTSERLDVAQRFIGIDPTVSTPSNRSREDRRQFALLEIDVHPGQLAHITLADVSGQSPLPDEHEMIFGLGSTFIITKITFNTEWNVWHIQMIPSSEVAQLSLDYSTYIRKRLTEIKPVLFFGNVLADMSSDHIGALRYFHRLLRTAPIDDEDRPNIYFQLARIYRYMRKYSQAITYYRCAKLLQYRNLPQQNFDYARTLTGLAVVYSDIGESARSVILHIRAMFIFRRILPEDHIEIGHVLHRLAYAYWQEKQYEYGLSLVSKSLSFFQRIMPANHPGQAQALHTMGLIHHALNHREQALDCIKQALHIRELLQANDAPAVAYECYELSVIYAEQNDECEMAMNYAQRALSICQTKLPRNDTYLKQINELVKRLHQQTTT